jgi:hypothetical protein
VKHSTISRRGEEEFRTHTEGVSGEGKKLFGGGEIDERTGPIRLKERPHPYEAGRATEAEEKSQRNKGRGTESGEKSRLEVVPVSGFMWRSSHMATTMPTSS